MYAHDIVMRLQWPCKVVPGFASDEGLIIIIIIIGTRLGVDHALAPPEWRTSAPAGYPAGLYPSLD